MRVMDLIDNVDEPLSDYEQLRLAKIARNEAKLVSLGLLSNKQQSGDNKTTPKKKKKKSQKLKVKTGPTRRSSRTVGAKPKYKEDKINQMIVTPSPKKIKQEFTNQQDDEEDEANQMIRKKMKDEMQRLQQSVESARSLYFAASSGDSEEEAQKICFKLWGRECCPPNGTTWSLFLSSRTATPTAHLPSPYGMMQEVYAHDGWRLLVCCVLMSRVSSIETKDRCIRRFFELCPQPSDLSRMDLNELEQCVHSLGFQYERVKAVTHVTIAWLTRGEFKLDTVAEKKGGHKIYMCGPFAIDSYELFCKGNSSWKVTCGIRDVMRFASWLKRKSLENE